MKFTDGYWQMRPNVAPHYAAHVHSIDIKADALTVYAPTKYIAGRGDTLNQPMLTVHFSSPLENVIHVQIVHHKGARRSGPSFELIEENPDVRVEDTEAIATLTSGDLSVQIAKGTDWDVEFQVSGKTLTGSGFRGLGLVDTPEGRFVHEQLDLGVGEYVYGLGERFTAFVKNGQVIDMWNADGGTASEQAYKNIPFYLTNRGYGVFVNHPEKVSFEFASEKVKRVQFSVPGEYLEYFVLYGPTPKDILERYTALTGRPALPPAWSFGLWLTTSFTTDYDEETVTGFIQGMADREIPLHVFHFDCFWMKEFHWTDFEWDSDVFPDPKSMLQRLKARGLRICVWINPYIAQRSALFDEGMQNGYLLKHPNGDVWQWDKWQSGMGIVDFTNPAACRWYAAKLRELLDMGVDSFKTDFGERIPTDVVYHDGSDPFKMHNYYPYLYNRTVFEVLEEKRGKGDAVVFARSATAGGQQFPVHWGGDNESSFESMAESLRGGLSLGLSGFGFWSHDIGGFEGTPPAAVYKRWIAFGLLSSHSRLHGSSSYRVPWLYDEEAVDVLRFFTRLKCRLMPYLYAQALNAQQHGTPMMRAMLLEFPDDPTCDYLDRQYMLGDSLLVAPVFSEADEVIYYVPAGRWTNFIGGDVIAGPGWKQERHGFLSLPLLVRPNSVLAVGSQDDVPDYDFGDSVTLQAYQIEDGAEIVTAIPTLSGEVAGTFTTHRTGNTLTVTSQGISKPWRFLLVGVEAVSEVDGGSAESTTKGTLVTPADASQTLTISIR
ncbi:MAG: alpha-xylosidase [Anaerolineales bacterium]|nr:alpha-xylosidase [Anaerolineales bacterium]